MEGEIPEIIASDNFGITAFSEDASYPDSFWTWALSDSNPYAGGLGRYYGNDDTWQSIRDGVTDFCFVTYTIPNGSPPPPPEPPVITISTTSTVTMAFGGVSLLAAVITGSRYFILGAL